MTTLYISDLDGTLLHDNQQVSPFSASVINRAIERGLLFSLATARSLIGLGMLDLQGIHWNTPLVLMNGVMLYDMASRAILQSCEMPPDAVAAVLAAGRAAGYLCWAASALLGLFLLPDKGVALLYLIFLGLYPVVKNNIEGLRRLPLEWLCKLACFNAALSLF